MGGIYFYWFLWMGWIITTFLMPKNKNRTMLSAGCLLIISISGHTIYVYGIGIQASFIFLILVSFMLISVKRIYTILFYAICSLIIGAAYTSFHLFEIYDPVWFVLPRTLMLSLLIVYLVSLLIKDRWERLVVLSIGIGQGELFNFLVMKQFLGEFIIGSFQFLDIWAICVFLISSWSFFGICTTYLENYVQRVQKGKVQQ